MQNELISTGEIAKVRLAIDKWRSIKTGRTSRMSPRLIKDIKLLTGKYSIQQLKRELSIDGRFLTKLRIKQGSSEVRTKRRQICLSPKKLNFIEIPVNIGLNEERAGNDPIHFEIQRPDGFKLIVSNPEIIKSVMGTFFSGGGR